MQARLRRFFNPEEEGRLPWRLFWVGFGVRVMYITLAHTYRIRLTDDHFQFGWEMGRIARALATGYGYADPFNGHSGPTAWTPPLYPLLMAGVFKLFGVYTLQSAWVILTINSVFSAATAPAVYEIARRTFVPSADARLDGRRVALWSGWLWALYPAAMQYAVRWVWDMALTAFLFSWVVVLALRLRGLGEPDRARWRLAGQSSRRWIAFGVVWGLIALSNSSLLLFLPACGLWVLWPTLRGPHGLGRALRDGALAAICFLVVVTPWVARNWMVFHAFVPMRANFGAELFEAAQLSNQGFPLMATLPLSEASPQFQRYKRLGEIAYSKEQGERAAIVIRSHRGLFFENAVRRVYFFWVGVPHPSTDVALVSSSGRFVRASSKVPELLEAGRILSYSFLSLGGLLGLFLALRRRVPVAWLFFWAFASLPLLYYFVTVQARFRHPLEPLISILTVYLFQSADRRRTWSW